MLLSAVFVVVVVVVVVAAVADVVGVGVVADVVVDMLLLLMLLLLMLSFHLGKVEAISGGARQIKCNENKSNWDLSCHICNPVNVQVY